MVDLKEKYVNFIPVGINLINIFHSVLWSRSRTFLLEPAPACRYVIYGFWGGINAAILIILVKLQQLLHKLKEQIGTFLEKNNYLLLFFKTEFFSLNLCSKFFFPEPEPVSRPGAGQSRTGSTTLRGRSYRYPEFNFMGLDKINRIRRDPDPQPCPKVWYIYLVFVPGVTPRMLKGDDWTVRPCPAWLWGLDCKHCNKHECCTLFTRVFMCVVP